MEFFDKLGGTITTVGKDLSKKAKDVSGITKLKLDIRSKEEYVRDQYMHIGKSYYHAHKGEDVPEKEMFERVEKALDEIAQMELRILELKNTKKCPNCGAEAADTAEYCSVCGTKLGLVADDEESETEDAGEQKAETEESAGEQQAEAGEEAEEQKAEAGEEAEPCEAESEGSEKAAL